MYILNLRPIDLISRFSMARTKQLRDHFAAYGRVLDCVAMRQPDGRPRGFGYVTLDSPQAAELGLAQAQVIDGRVVDMKRAVPEGDMDSAPTTRRRGAFVQNTILTAT